jgi:hypothetical protein
LLEHEPKWQKKGERRKHFMHNKNLWISGKFHIKAKTTTTHTHTSMIVNEFECY